jgi:hypothetical protein
MMRNKRIVASILIVALIVVCGASLFATWQGIQMAQGKGIHFNGSWMEADTASAQATETKTVNVQEPINLSAVTDHGSITVVAGKDGQVIVKAEKTAFGNSDADAQAALKGLKVVIEQEGKTIKVWVDQSVEVSPLHIGPVGGTVNFTITVPVKTAVILNSRQGNLSLSGTSANAQLKTDSGSLDITDVTGEVVGQSNNGEITAQNIGAVEMIELSSEFGSVTAENVKGSDITLSTSNGQLNKLKNIHATGLLKIISEFGDIHLAGGQAKSAEMRSKNGTIGLEELNVDGNIIVKSDFGNLTLQEVNANAYDLNTQNGKINLDGAQDTIKAHSDFGSIEVLNAKNANIDLSSNNGAITFSGSLGNGPHTLSSDFGNIELTLPLKSALNLSLKTDFGKITSNFSITVNGTMNNKHWNGTINGGGAELTVKTSNGNITLQASK